MKMQKRSTRKNERGLALIVALFALLLISAVAFGMMYMSNTETSINYNYRAEQQAYFAATGGLEEARDRLWSSTQGAVAPLGLGVGVPTALPSLTNAGIIYITNPSAADGVVHPWDPNSPYYDDELCHENYTGLNMVDSGVGNRCPTSSLPASAGWYTEVHSAAPFTGTAAALSFKWVRIAVKNNKSANPYFVDGNPSSTNANVVCWNQFDQQEDLLSKNGFPAAGPRDVDPQIMLAGLKKSWFQRTVDKVFDPPVVYAYDKGHSSGSTTGNGNGNGSGSSGSSGSNSSGSSSGSSGSSTTSGSSDGGSGSTSSDGGSGSTSSSSGSTSGGGSGVNPNPTSCEDPTQAFPRKTVYTVTALAKTSSGGRKMVQYELANNIFTTPPVPSPLTIVGPNPGNHYGVADSTNFTVNGNDAHQGPNGNGCSVSSANKDALTVSDSGDVSQMVNALNKRPQNYTGLSGTTPDVSPLAATASNWNDINFLNALVSSLRTQAQSSNRYFNTFNGAALPSTMNWGSTSNPQITFVDGNATIDSTQGSGLLIVTGDLTITGNSSWKGSILVIGDGYFTFNGGGNGQITGGLFVAKTGDLDNSGSPTKLIPSATLESPWFDWTGGGTNAMQWDSCWANVMNGTSGNYYKVISFRELMY